MHSHFCVTISYPTVAASKVYRGTILYKSFVDSIDIFYTYSSEHHAKKGRRRIWYHKYRNNTEVNVSKVSHPRARDLNTALKEFAVGVAKV